MCPLGAAYLTGGNKIIEVDVHYLQGCCLPVLWGLRPLPVVRRIGALSSVSAWVTESPSSRCGEAVCRTGMDWLAKYVTVSIAMQKYGALSTHTMGRYKWNPTICSSAGYSLGRSKDVDGVYSSLTQRRIYVSSGSTLLR